MRVWILGSGSRGNSVLLESSGGSLLVDAGFAPAELSRRLAAVGAAPESIHGVVLTHEHGDHSRGAAAVAARYGWTVFATPGTLGAAPALRDTPATAFAAGSPFDAGPFEITPVRASHDAADPVIVVATERCTGARCGVVYDTGRVTHAVARILVGVDVLVLEANHDEEMLRAGPYPRGVRERIAGPRGHLGNHAAAATAVAAASRSLAHVILAHLSESCNTPAAASRTVGEGLRHARSGARLSVSLQGRPVGPFAPGRRQRASQLELAL